MIYTTKKSLKGFDFRTERSAEYVVPDAEHAERRGDYIVDCLYSSSTAVALVSKRRTDIPT